MRTLFAHVRGAPGLVPEALDRLLLHQSVGICVSQSSPFFACVSNGLRVHGAVPIIGNPVVLAAVVRLRRRRRRLRARSI